MSQAELIVNRKKEPEYKNYAQYLKHPKFKEIRAVAMSRCNGVCEDCGNSKATEVHHVTYPTWGEFDVPENIVAVCHACHCIRHGVPR